MTISYLETGVLYCEDNLRQLSKFPPDCVDLIYLDPPFFSNRQYEVIWGDEAVVRSFEDRWEGGIQVYINWMQERGHPCMHGSCAVCKRCQYGDQHARSIGVQRSLQNRRIADDLPL